MSPASSTPPMQRKQRAHPLAVMQTFLQTLVRSDVLCPSCTDLPALGTCALVIFLWFAFQVLLERILPCEIVQGVPLPDKSGKRLAYRINGHLAFWTTLVCLEVGWPRWSEIHSGDELKSVLVFGRAPLTWLYDHHATLAFVTILWCILLSTYLYLKSFGKGPAPGGGGRQRQSLLRLFHGAGAQPSVGLVRLEGVL